MSDVAELSPETIDLLRRGTLDGYGLVCRPGEIQKLYPFLKEAERLDYIRFIDIERPWITEAGRAAVGAPCEAEEDRRRAAEIWTKPRPPLVPSKRADPRTDFDYRSYKAMNLACVLALRAPDDRTLPRPSVKIIVPGSWKPEGLGAGNSIIQPEAEGTKFVLACIPVWLQRKLKLPSGGLPLPEHETQWSDEDRETWDRLRQVCFSINSRIRIANRRPKQALRFGETA